MNDSKRYLYDFCLKHFEYEQFTFMNILDKATEHNDERLLNNMDKSVTLEELYNDNVIQRYFSPSLGWMYQLSPLADLL